MSEELNNAINKHLEALKFVRDLLSPHSIQILAANLCRGGKEIEFPGKGLWGQT